MKSRRTEPGRRDRLIDITIDLIAEIGVAGLSHRKIAARADVPLGTLTYHFGGMDGLLYEAFTRFANSIADTFTARLGAAADAEQAQAAVLDLIHSESGRQSNRDLVIVFELYTLAARDPKFRRITSTWMRRSREDLERHFSPRAARQLDALIEGAAIHRALDPEPADRELMRDAVAKIVARG
ncbi:TetR/AcrR family transcriptional regulator [Streptomyces litchfieldiae]|uniref:TetR family transcriptional regulator n=1 Tax=Streptomyces litchfieldiae TaxID=3075543 RepID=A0ABU2MS30_9ACTN|nr:TetR family transcriptional regulator [Streptomyces sp. DSM 44938]MDT0343904.1 TetR family transcriptional regulator [Streptomyces sp. DSM 44938]